MKRITIVDEYITPDGLFIETNINEVRGIRIGDTVSDGGREYSVLGFIFSDDPLCHTVKIKVEI